MANGNSKHKHRSRYIISLYYSTTLYFFQVMRNSWDYPRYNTSHNKRESCTFVNPYRIVFYQYLELLSKFLLRFFLFFQYQWRVVQKVLINISVKSYSLQWRHNGCHSVSNRQPHECSLNRLLRRRSKKISKLRVTDLCVWNSPVTGEFPAQTASNAENISIWWRHHVIRIHIF